MEEVQALQIIHSLVINNYVNGHPRHHLPTARQKIFQPDSSMFFIVKFDDYISLSGTEVQDIFQNRHIVVTNIPSRRYPWSRNTLAMLGSLTQDRDIHGIVYYLKVFTQANLIDIATLLDIGLGTLNDIYATTQQDNGGQVMSASGLAIGNTTLPGLPNIR
jgi:hypothetical protein